MSHKHENESKCNGVNENKVEPVKNEDIDKSVSEIIEESFHKKDHKKEDNHEQSEKECKAEEKKPLADSKEDEIKKLKDEVECLKDSKLRILAEFDNYKRRTARDSVRLIESANEGLVKSIIPVLENFERALHPDHKNSDTEAIQKGIELVYNMFLDTLKKAGLTESNPIGEEFDPEKHEAIMHVDSNDVPENKINQVFQKGYNLNNKVVQYAKVSVSKGNAS